MSLFSKFKPSSQYTQNSQNPCAMPIETNIANIADIAGGHEKIKEATFCPLCHLNRNAICVDPKPHKGLVLTADYTLNEGLKGQIILWTLQHFDSIVTALWWRGPEIPRRVIVKSLNRYQLPKE